MRLRAKLVAATAAVAAVGAGAVMGVAGPAGALPQPGGVNPFANLRYFFAVGGDTYEFAQCTGIGDRNEVTPQRTTAGTTLTAGAYEVLEFACTLGTSDNRDLWAWRHDVITAPGDYAHNAVLHVRNGDGVEVARYAFTGVWPRAIADVFPAAGSSSAAQERVVFVAETVDRQL